MQNRKTEDIVFEATASCTVLVACTAFAALLYQLIVIAVPLLESMLLQQVR